ncbi:Dehydrogenase/reductase SDR family member 11 [Armadillidium nasatum]|uniref:Dehydrogenase/reductase SDR family member 11 n=1 Tax=Armadillidium nasatum TaxID=96803 RepID=A0A5N5TPE2_9CRUS|nr:Dehydrogenase/reductase SDR family member 11 [Armadillidium nasatum]
MERWKGRVALVTGASAGIGAAVCKVLVEAGMNVVGAARGVEKIEILANSLHDAKGTLTAVKCDVTKEEDIYNLFREIKGKFGGVDICVNNAGISYDKTLLDGSVAEWRNMTDVNIIAPCICSKLSIESMRERGIDDGHIINVNSTSGHRVSGFAEVHFYAGTKYALTAITEGLRQEMRELKSHIRISKISPGFVETEFFTRMFSSNEEKAQEIYKSRMFLQPEDIANSVLHIISSPPHVEINDILVRPTEQAS